MAAADKADGRPRLIPRGSCSWCGHKPHPDACPSTIRTDTGMSPCPCTRHANVPKISD